MATDVTAVVAAHGFIQRSITIRHAQVTSDLPPYHTDPMDRLLIGQAIVEDMVIVAAGRAFASYSVKLLW